MKIQIWGKSKCFDTKKAERYFKERRIPYQAIDLLRYGMSRGELTSVKNAVGLEDVLGYQVLAGPVLFVVRSVRPAESGDIVKERVEPDVGDVVLVERKLDAPGETALGTGNAEVLETAGIDKTEKF